MTCRRSRRTVASGQCLMGDQTRGRYTRVVVREKGGITVAEARKPDNDVPIPSDVGGICVNLGHVVGDTAWAEWGRHAPSRRPQ